MPAKEVLFEAVLRPSREALIAVFSEQHAVLRSANIKLQLLLFASSVTLVA